MSADRRCEYCGAPLVRNPKHSNKQWENKRFCERRCSGAFARKPPNLCDCGCGEPPLPQRRWIKGHRPIKPMATGYKRVWVTKAHPLASSDGNCLEHRLVLWNAGVEIPFGWQVHHKNGDKLDNRIENLEVLPADEHARLHAVEAGTITNQFGTFPLRRKVAA